MSTTRSHHEDLAQINLGLRLKQICALSRLFVMFSPIYATASVMGGEERKLQESWEEENRQVSGAGGGQET